MGGCGVIHLAEDGLGLDGAADGAEGLDEAGVGGSAGAHGDGVHAGEKVEGFVGAVVGGVVVEQIVVGLPRGFFMALLLVVVVGDGFGIRR